MIFLAPTFVLGAWCLQQMPVLPSLSWLVALIPLALISYQSRFKLPSQISLALLALGAGFMWAAAIAHIRLADELPRQWEGQNIQVIGVVASLPQSLERSERFEFDVEQVLTSKAIVPRHISLSQYSENFYVTDDVGREPAKINTFHAGERWRLTVRLKRPHGTVNPHGFDFEAWALERNIRATGSVKKDTENHLLDAFVLRPGYLVEAAREKVRERMNFVLAGKPYNSVLRALAIGDDSSILQDDWQVFLRTGTSHLVSISGLHITMLAGLAYGLVYAGWRRNEKLTLYLPARKAATTAAVIIALLYALMAGFSVPTQRTLYMLAVFAVALWSGRNVTISHVLACALLLVVILDPWAVMAPGFWLSFSAVAVIAYAMGGRLRRPHWLSVAVTTQWAVTLGMLPLLLVLFQQVSIISPIANAIAIPLISFVVVPFTLLGALLPLDWALQFAHSIIATCMQLMQWLGALPFSTWQQHAPPAWTLFPALFGVLWMLLPRGFPMRWLGLIGLLPMILLEPPRPALGAMQVTVLDVGQGLAVTLRTATHTLLYDTGPAYSAQSDAGSRIVVPYLRGEGVGKLDGLIVSHNDTDHSGGMASVMAQIPVDWVDSSLLDNTVALAAHEHVQCYAGQWWVWDNVRFDVLHPSPDSYENTDIKDNNRSCVLRVTSQFGSLLLTGDIEHEAEAELLESFPGKLASDVLIAPHHGSKTSSTPEFIATVQPRVAIFTLGYRNRFGHPKQAVLQRYTQFGSKIYRSDYDGAVLLDFADSRAISIVRWRHQVRHYWQDATFSGTDVPD